MAQPRRDPAFADLPTGAEYLSLLAGLTAGLAYSTFATFVANALTPVTGFLIDGDIRRAISGHYQEVFSLDGAFLTVAISLLVFVAVWWSTRVLFDHWNREEWQRIGAVDRRLADGPLLIPMIKERLASAASK